MRPAQCTKRTHTHTAHNRTDITQQERNGRLGEKECVVARPFRGMASVPRAAATLLPQRRTLKWRERARVHKAHLHKERWDDREHVGLLLSDVADVCERLFRLYVGVGARQTNSRNTNKRKVAVSCCTVLGGDVVYVDDSSNSH